MEKSNYDNEMAVVHSGTTLENYRICAYRAPRGVVFNKKRQPLHDFMSFFFVPALEGGARYALEVARELKHTPLIMKGKVRDSQKLDYELPIGEEFPVDRVYMPKHGIDWRQINPHNIQSLEDSLMEINPEDLI
jgi:hypothetical protein